MLKRLMLVVACRGDGDRDGDGDDSVMVMMMATMVMMDACDSDCGGSDGCFAPLSSKGILVAVVLRLSSLNLFLSLLWV